MATAKENNSSDSENENVQPTVLSTDEVNTPTNASTVPVPEKSNQKNVQVRLPWTHPKLQGDDDEHSGFGFPTIEYPNAVELTSEQYEKAKAAARTARFRLKEVG